MEDPIFIPIKGYIDYPSIDEEDIEQTNKNNKKWFIIIPIIAVIAGAAAIMIS